MAAAADEGSRLRPSGLVSLISACFLVASSCASLPPDARLLGVHPLDEKLYAAEVIKCRDGSKSFTKDRLNDNFCDCIDGTDEPGTSACPAAKFYCRNVGSTPKFIYSSRVNDYFCDCCDGSDEYDGRLRCPNTCIMGGNVEYKAERYAAKTTILGIDNKEPQNGMNLDEMIQKLKEFYVGTTDKEENMLIDRVRYMVTNDIQVCSLTIIYVNSLRGSSASYFDFVELPNLTWVARQVGPGSAQDNIKLIIGSMAV